MNAYSWLDLDSMSIRQPKANCTITKLVLCILNLAKACSCVKNLFQIVLFRPKP